MIKKNTKVIFENGDEKETEDLMGGMPLSRGEIVHFHKDDSVIDYEVIDKDIHAFSEGEDKIVNITYTLRKK